PPLYSPVPTTQSSFMYPATSASVPLPLPDAIPIWVYADGPAVGMHFVVTTTRAKSVPPSWTKLPPTAGCTDSPIPMTTQHWESRDRKSTRLNSSHVSISYAVFCLQKTSMNSTEPVS